jgi:hypothetical protein
MNSDPQNQPKESFKASFWFGLIVDSILLFLALILQGLTLLFVPALIAGGLSKLVVLARRQDNLRRSDHLWLRHGGLVCFLTMMLMAAIINTIRR